MQGVHNADLKKQAIILRHQGFSYPMIGIKLGVPKATLSGWLAGLKLSEKIEGKLLKRKQNNLVIARGRAWVVLNKQREDNKKIVEESVGKSISQVNFDDHTKEMLLTMLYLGEGFKRVSVVGLGNSNAKIMSVFVNLLRSVYNVPEKKLTCYLHLRSDQNVGKETTYWSNVLKINKSQFRKAQFDKRTIGTKTWKEYHGVCVVYCADAKIEKRLTVLQDLLLKKLLS